MSTDKVIRVRTPLFRASYVYVWEPRPNSDPTKKAKYQLCMLFPKDSTDIAELRAAAKQAAIAFFGEQRATALMNDPASSGFKWPLRDGDTKYATNPDKYASYKGMIFMNANSTAAPGIVEIVGNKTCRIVEQDQFYSGCWAVATVAFKGYQQDGGIGVGCYLNNICKMKDDEKLAGGVDAEADFADFAAQNPNSSSGSAADPLLG